MKGFALALIAIGAAALALSIVFIISSQAFRSQPDNNMEVLAANSTGGSLTVVTIANRGPLVGGAIYLVTPNPFTGFGNYTLVDDSDGDIESSPGLTTISGIQNGNYTVTQTKAPAGYARDTLSKIARVNDNVATATFINFPEGEDQFANSDIESITYTAKFQCGSIAGGEGPLRPGHYDTDISIFNKQESSVKMIWNAIINDGEATNGIIKTLQPETSTAIVCNDLRELFSTDAKFVEGFVIIRIQLPGTLGSIADDGTAVIMPLSPDDIDFLDVQVFYTANALATLPKEIFVDKITFSILNDASGKIPSSMLGKTLDITLESKLNEISDTESRVKSAVAEKYGMSEQEISGLEIRIENVSVGVGALIDDHALSLVKVEPQAGS